MQQLECFVRWKRKGRIAAALQSSTVGLQRHGPLKLQDRVDAELGTVIVAVLVGGTPVGVQSPVHVPFEVEVRL